MWNREVSVSYFGYQKLKLPKERFEHTPLLSGKNYQKIWEIGDFTLREAISDQLIVARHTLQRVISSSEKTHAASIKRQLYHIHIDQKDFIRLTEAMQNWRCDDVLQGWYPHDILRSTFVSGTKLKFIHKLTGSSFIGTLIETGKKPTFWLATITSN